MRIGIVVGARVRVFPIGEPGGEVELAERLWEFSRAVLENPDLSNCLAGLHQHSAGDCARGSDGARS